MDREQLAHYRIIDRLGAGGMGEVYRARDSQLDRDVAVKVLPSSTFDDPTARARLVREARAAAALNHPNIVQVYDFGTEEDLAYIVMEHIQGSTLNAILKVEGPMEPLRVLGLALQLCGSLAEAHSLAAQSAIASALGYTGDQRSVAPLLELLNSRTVTAKARAFAAVALGNVADKGLLPWNAKIGLGLNYRAAPATLTDPSGAGILDLF